MLGHMDPAKHAGIFTSLNVGSYGRYKDKKIAESSYIRDSEPNLN